MELFRNSSMHRRIVKYWRNKPVQSYDYAYTVVSGHRSYGTVGNWVIIYAVLFKDVCELMLPDESIHMVTEMRSYYGLLYSGSGIFSQDEWGLFSEISIEP